MGPTDLGYAKTDASGRWPLLMALHPVRSACQRRWFALSIGCQVAQFSVSEVAQFSVSEVAQFSMSPDHH
jgi:hypothetical protein